jgi:hypothetical protein
MSDKYYKYFSSEKYNKKEKEELINHELKQLYKTPTKDKNKSVPLNNNSVSGCVYQADILFMPDDNGYKYCLVVVDTADGRTDAIPIKNKDNKTVIDAFKKAFKTLGEPNAMQVDSGSEFKGLTADFFEKEEIPVKVSLVGRSRQMSYAENRNKTIGRSLFERMTAQELLTGKQSNQWMEDLKNVLKAINKRAKATFKAKLKRLSKNTEPILIDNLFNYGDTVRVILDKPRDTFNKKLHGSFRATDIRFSTEFYTIDNIIINNGVPPLYMVKNVETGEVKPVAYTKNQLLLVTDKIIEPPKSVVRGNPKPKIYIIKDIDGKRKKNNLVQYNVLYKGHKVYQWENRKDLININENKILINGYEKLIK